MCLIKDYWTWWTWTLSLIEKKYYWCFRWSIIIWQHQVTGVYIFSEHTMIQLDDCSSDEHLARTLQQCQCCWYVCIYIINSCNLLFSYLKDTSAQQAFWDDAAVGHNLLLSRQGDKLFFCVLNVSAMKWYGTAVKTDTTNVKCVSLCLSPVFITVFQWQCKLIHFGEIRSQSDFKHHFKVLPCVWQSIIWCRHKFILFWRQHRFPFS